MDDRSHLWETWRTCQGYYNKKTSLHGWYCWSFILRHGEQYQPTPHCNFGKMTRQIPSLKLIKSDCRAAKIEIGMEIKMSYWGRKRSICWLPSQQYCTIVEELFGLRQGVLPSKQSCTYIWWQCLPRRPGYQGTGWSVCEGSHACCQNWNTGVLPSATYSWSCYLLYISLLL